MVKLNLPHGLKIEPYHEGQDFYNWVVGDVIKPVYGERERESRRLMVEHLTESGELAAQVAVPPNDYYMRLLGLFHDIVEDTRDLDKDFPARFVFEDPEFDYNSGEIRPRHYIREKRVYALDGLFYEAGVLGRALVRGVESLTRKGDEENYLASFDKLKDFSIDLKESDEKILWLIFKVVGDRQSNARDIYGIPQVNQIRNMIDDLSFYIPSLKTKLSEIEGRTRGDSSNVGDYLYNYGRVISACEELEKLHEANMKRLKAELGEEEYNRLTTEASEQLGGRRRKSIQSGEVIKRQLIDRPSSMILYEYLRRALEHHRTHLI